MSSGRLLRAAPGEGPVHLWWRARRRPADMVLVPLTGGAGAFVGASRLISLLEPPGPPAPWPRRLLERLQARRSRLLVAAEREVAVDCVRRWNLHLSRIRLVADVDRGLQGGLAGDLQGRIPGRAAWHSAR